MKKMIILAGILACTSCDMNNPDMLRKQITQKKDKIRDLSQQVDDLENKLNSDSLDNKNHFVVPVNLKKMAEEPFSHYVELNGKLEAVENAVISPEMNGQIEEILVDEGDRVIKGQMLVKLNTSLTESSMKEVRTSLELAEKVYEKQKGLWDQKIGSELEYLQAKNSRDQARARLATLESQLDMAHITAPFNGIVETIFLKQGEMAAPGVQVLQLVSLDRLKIYVDLSEKYLGSVKKGDEVQIEFPELHNRNMTVPIRRIGNVIDEETRTFRIELKVSNPDGDLKPNMFTIIRVNDFSTPGAMVVPSLIIKQDIKGKYLYVASETNGKMTAFKKYVETGLSYHDQTMVTKGIGDGDLVIVKGYSQVSGGAEVAEK